MFLIQLMYLSNKNLKSKEELEETKNTSFERKDLQSLKINTEAVSQIKNIKQEEAKLEKKNNETINSVNDIIRLCLEKKEMKLKYELENNVNLVSFSNNRIEISFNEKLSNDFVKDLSEKLFDWTNNRWIISFSKQKGEKSVKDEKKISQEKIIDKFKKSNEYDQLLKSFPDIELIDVKNKND